MSFSEWKTYQISELGKVVTGKTPPTKDKENFGNEYPFITPVDMNGQKTIYKTERNLSEIGKNKVKNFLLPKDAICISCIGSDLGKVVKTSRPSLTNQQINSIICNDSFDSDFVFYSLKLLSPTLKSIGHQSTAVPIINKTDFSKFEIDAPENKKTQQHIASILSSLDDAIALNQQINKTLEEMAKAIFKEWFVDFNFPISSEPLITDDLSDDTDLIKSSKSHQSQKSQFRQFYDTEIGKIPVGWKVGTIESILFHSKNSVNPSKQPDEDFYHYSIPAYDEGNNPSVEKGSTILSNKFQVKSNSILVSKLNPRFPRTWAIGEIEEERSICSTEFQVLVPRKPFYYSFGLWVFAQTFVIDKMKGNATGTSGSHQRVRPQDILDIEIALPNDDILKLYHDTVSAFSKQIDDNKKENQSLINLRDTLLPKLMKGEIEING